MSDAGIVRRATCACGQLAVDCAGDPVRISVCHCLDCQRRSGSSFAAQARFPVDCLQVSGQSRQWTRVGDSGGEGRFNFCPECGSTVFYTTSADPGVIAVAIGGFADPAFPAPIYSVYEERKHNWVAITGDGIDHYG